MDQKESTLRVRSLQTRDQETNIRHLQYLHFKSDVAWT